MKKFSATLLLLLSSCSSVTTFFDHPRPMGYCWLPLANSTNEILQQEMMKCSRDYPAASQFGPCMVLKGYHQEVCYLDDNSLVPKNQ